MLSKTEGYEQLSSVQADDRLAILDEPVLAAAPQANSLQRMFDHFVQETNGDSIPFNQWEKGGFFCEVLGGSGGIYAWPSAWAYAKSFTPSFVAYSFAVTNPISNALFLVKATDDLLDTLKSEARIPEAIRDLINVPGTKSLVAKYTKMTLGSLVCVIPFGVSVYLFPLPQCKEPWCIGLTVAHSTLSSAILHGVAWNLIITPEFWYYRLPVLPFEKLYEWLKSKCTSFESQELKRLSGDKEKIFHRYRQLMVTAMNTTSDDIVREYLNAPNSMHTTLRMMEFTGINFQSFIALANLQTRQQGIRQANDQTARERAAAFIANNIVGFIGGLVMVVACIGLVTNPIYVGLLEGLSLNYSLLLAVLPAYSTAVLCAFYGSAVANQIFNYITQWPEKLRDKLSLEAQIYPKTYSLYLLANLYVSFFSYATTQQLIDTVFADKRWDDIRPALGAISIPTLQMLSFIPLMELFNVMARKSVAKFGAPSKIETQAMRLLQKTAVMTHYVQQMVGEALMSGIGELTKQQQQRLGINPTNFAMDVSTLNQLQGQMDQFAPVVAAQAPKEDHALLAPQRIFSHPIHIQKREGQAKMTQYGTSVSSLTN